MSAGMGWIYKDDTFYLDQSDGVLKAKYLLVLAALPRHDLVVRLLTSRHPELRPEHPACFHGDPYPGFYLGVLGGPLTARSWLDLRFLDDFDPKEFDRKLQIERLREVMPLPAALLRSALLCAASADDTTVQQERRLRDALTIV